MNGQQFKFTEWKINRFNLSDLNAIVLWACLTIKITIKNYSVQPTPPAQAQLEGAYGVKPLQILYKLLALPQKKKNLLNSLRNVNVKITILGL